MKSKSRTALEIFIERQWPLLAAQLIALVTVFVIADAGTGISVGAAFAFSDVVLYLRYRQSLEFKPWGLHRKEQA